MPFTITPKKERKKEGREERKREEREKEGKTDIYIYQNMHRVCMLKITKC